jgi:tetratricopeptide (TPR) repeat protein
LANPRIDDLRRRLEREPGSRLFAQLAEELRKDGDLEEAIRVAREGLQKHPAYPSARMTLGRALLDKGELLSARSEFESVLKGAADNILASRYLGECLEGLGELEGAAARYKATLLLSPGDRQVQSRLDDVETRLRRRSSGLVAAAGQEPRPIPVAQVDEPMVLEAAHEGPVVRTGDAPGFEGAGKAPPAAPLAVAEESFELERPREVPAVSEWRPQVFVPEGEVVFEDDDASITIPPGVAPAALQEPKAPFVATAEVSRVPGVEPIPVVEAEVVPEVEAFVEPEPVVEPQPPLASPTLAELYLNQGFTDKAIEVYRQLLEREPGNERARARLMEIEALDRHLRAEELRGAPARAEAPPALSPAAPADPRARRREAIERTIARLEGFLAAVRKG